MTGASEALQQIEAVAGAGEQGVGLMDGQRQQRAEATAVNQLLHAVVAGSQRRLVPLLKYTLCSHAATITFASSRDAGIAFSA